MLLHRMALGAVLALAATVASAQLFTPDNPDWKESDVPPPPAFDSAKLIPVEVSQSSGLSFGVDPATIKITPEGIVRYVVVASSRSGAINAMYEGVRCATGNVRVYARYNRDSGWSPAANSTWQSLFASQATRYSLMIARAGICRGNAPNLSVEQTVRDLRTTPDRRFE